MASKKTDDEQAAAAAAEKGLHWRKAAPGTRFGYTDREGNAHEFRASADGVVKPKNVDQVAILRSMGLSEWKPSTSSTKSTSSKKAAGPAAVTTPAATESKES